MNRRHDLGFGFLFLLALALLAALLVFACSGTSGSAIAVDDDAADDDTADDDSDDDASPDDDNDDDGSPDDDDNDDSTPSHGKGNLIVNGGFETGQPAPWTGQWPYANIVGSDQDDDSAADDDTFFAIDTHSGKYAAYFGQVQMGSDTAWLGQTVAAPATASAATADFWIWLFKFGSATMTFTARLVDPQHPATVYADLGSWTQADAAFPPHYQEITYALTTAELAAVAGKNVMLRFDYVGDHPIITAAYVFLDDVALNVTW